MKLIIFTTCKPLFGDDAWRQEQAIKSWTLLENIEKLIIIIGNDYGTKEICEKYNLIHEPNIKNMDGVPYLYDMFLIANKYAKDDDVMLWTNSDMIYFQDMITTILSFKELHPHEKNYLLVGQRHDWHNPKILEEFDKCTFLEKMNLKNIPSIKVEKLNSLYNECSLHPACGIDYVLHSKTTFLNNLDPNLVIAGTRHDMIMLGVGLEKHYFTCDITNTCLVIHQNHDYINSNKNLSKLKNNNQKCKGTQRYISDSPFKTTIINNEIKFIKK
jgi:hypothetical protein